MMTRLVQQVMAWPDNGTDTGRTSRLKEPLRIRAHTRACTGKQRQGQCLEYLKLLLHKVAAGTDVTVENAWTLSKSFTILPRVV